MRRAIYLLILLVIAGAPWLAYAQSERRDRDRSSRDRDRNGERSRDRERNRESTNENSQPRVESSTNPPPAAVEQAATPAVETVSTNSGPVDPTSYDAFRIIAQRNIFDPNRRARSTNNEAPPERPRRSEAFTLLGSIAYEKGDFAFFEGSSSDYRKSVKAGDSIGGLKIAQIAPNHVTFEARDGTTMQLPIGSQMKRVEGEQWKINSQVESFSSPSNSGPTSISSGDSSSGSAGSSGNGETSEVLKRLLERAKKGE